jgi:hypothetical protein
MRPGYSPAVVLRTLAQMAPSERNTGTGLQVALQRDGSLLVAELDDSVDDPRTVLGGVNALAGIVLCKPPGDVGGEAGVIARRYLAVLQHVDESL